jgi:PAS domain S-box-containing protein
METPTLLIVDDEEYIVSSLARSLRDLFKIYKANSGSAAMEILACEKIDIILTDQRMPGMTGVDLLKQAYLLQPAAIGIINTAYTDVEALTTALNLGNVRGYISKPWNIDELRSRLLEAMLKQNDHFLQQVLDTTPDGICIFDMNEKRLIYANRGVEECLGYSFDALKSMPGGILKHLSHPDEAQKVAQHLRLLATTRDDSVFVIQSQLKHRNGDWRFLSFRNRVLRRADNGKPRLILSTLHDVTESWRAEETIRRHAAYSEALAQMALSLNKRLDEKLVLESVCEMAARALTVPFASVFMLDEQSKTLRLATSFGFATEDIRHFQPLPHAVLERLTAQFKDAGIIADIQKFDGLVNAKIFMSYDIRAVMGAGLFYHQKLTGVLAVFASGEARQFNREELTLLKGLAAQTAQAVENARLFKEVSSGENQLRALSNALMEVQEKERRSLALELHDEFGQLLSSTKLYLDRISALTDAADQRHLDRAQELILDLLRRVRRMALELRPTMLDDLGLLPALNWLFNDYKTETGEAVVFEQTGLNQRFSSQLEITVYRIVQEALTNVIQHAGTRQVCIRALADADSFNLQIVDHGVGFDPATILSGHLSSGLSGMRERARLLGGEMVIESAPGAGTVLTIYLLLNPGKDVR